ncbi:putative oxygen-independent coproporphyrinogen III oxidase [Cystobacter fuscus DSM 2262]|uniref:Oxygen-independent coproporphyrinogen III oxidase n=1 Tax=Cystobacter fuscus (strain ATCC 25194 / DSM 2262 / NBRC 100088 / M29) TaxID=1242864 RepID=S9NXX3_CYSF2|nr:STM4012 family radical SAM protein [Cystobacter fuscus]EPX55721.1 putative oxygen-independent coproporphyrinogen III oxidase [Cystobacter fuscus DSM 2262]
MQAQKAPDTVHERLAQGINTYVLPNYVYGYPSKRTYRNFERPIPIKEVWADEPREGEVNIYLHIPFCRYRCTYCTLFLTTRHDPTLIDRYIDKVCQQLAMYGGLASGRQVSSIYFGGGTPTMLTQAQFERIFSTLRRHFPKVADNAEISVEGAPDSMTPETLDCLKAAGVNRISMGLQSMHPRELAHSGRPYPVETAVEAIRNIRARFDHMNLDLIYGLTGQTRETWKQSLDQVLEFRPTTLSLYPVVARPLTHIKKQLDQSEEAFFTDEAKYNIYDENVAKLRDLGYRQESFTRFTLLSGQEAYLQESLDFKGVPLIGIGTGARSYVGRYHYSTDYAVGRAEANHIIEEFIKTDFGDDFAIEQGIVLDEEEQRRRFVVLNLTLSNLSMPAYEQRFGRPLRQDFPEELEAMEKLGCIRVSSTGTISLTDLGFKFSSLLASLFFSERMLRMEREYQAK